jgi:hypothetical protein
MNGFERVGARASAVVCALAIMCVSGQAFALDGYQDRRKLFWGLGLGGGVGLVNAEDPQDATGLDQGRKLGMHLSGVVGGGLTQNITLGGEVNLWSRQVRINDAELAHNHANFMALANLFLIEGLHLEGGAGFAYGAYDTVRGSGQTTSYGEMGLALKAGAGFEFFVNSQIAIGVRAGYTRHFYTNGDFDTVAGGATFRWY